MFSVRHASAKFVEHGRLPSQWLSKTCMMNAVNCTSECDTIERRLCSKRSSLTFADLKRWALISAMMSLMTLHVLCYHELVNAYCQKMVIRDVQETTFTSTMSIFTRCSINY